MKKKNTSIKLKKLWLERKGKLDKETLRGLLKLNTGTCPNFISPNQCTDVAYPKGEECTLCCLYCDRFLTCNISFSCLHIRNVLIKMIGIKEEECL